MSVVLLATNIAAKAAEALSARRAEEKAEAEAKADKKALEEARCHEKRRSDFATSLGNLLGIDPEEMRDPAFLERMEFGLTKHDRNNLPQEGYGVVLQGIPFVWLSKYAGPGQQRASFVLNTIVKGKSFPVKTLADLGVALEKAAEPDPQPRPQPGGNDYNPFDDEEQA